MGTYKATRDYRSVDNGRPFVFTPGETVELDDVRAAWVNRDSPGTLKPVGKKASKPQSDDDGASVDEPDGELCGGTTAAGEPCRNSAGGDGFCRFHSDDS